MAIRYWWTPTKWVTERCSAHHPTLCEDINPPVDGGKYPRCQTTSPVLFTPGEKWPVSNRGSAEGVWHLVGALQILRTFRPEIAHLGWPQDDPDVLKMISKWHQDDSRMIPKISSKRCQHDVRMTPRWSQDLLKMISRWSRDDLRMIAKISSKWCQDDSKMIRKMSSKWCQNDLRMTPRWSSR